MTPTIGKGCFFALFFAAGALARAADVDEISTDRPDFTESTDTVSPGVVQLEGGVLLTRHAQHLGTSRYIGAPFSLMRVGVSRILELRLDTDGFASEKKISEVGREAHAGESDIEAGLKVRLWSERKFVPAFAIIGAFSVPTGSTYFSSGGVDRAMELCWGKGLGHGFDVAGNVNFRWEPGGGETEHAMSVSVAKKFTYGFGAYAEVYRISPIEGDEPLHWVANTGLTKTLGANTQLDVEIGHTMAARTPLWFFGAGFAIRMPAMRGVRGIVARVHEKSHPGS